MKKKLLIAAGIVLGAIALFYLGLLLTAYPSRKREPARLSFFVGENKNAPQNCGAFLKSGGKERGKNFPPGLHQ